MQGWVVCISQRILSSLRLFPVGHTSELPLMAGVLLPDNLVYSSIEGQQSGLRAPQTSTRLLLNCYHRYAVRMICGGSLLLLVTCTECGGQLAQSYAHHVFMSRGVPETIANHLSPTALTVNFGCLSPRMNVIIHGSPRPSIEQRKPFQRRLLALSDLRCAAVWLHCRGGVSM